MLNDNLMVPVAHVASLCPFFFCVGGEGTHKRLLGGCGSEKSCGWKGHTNSCGQESAGHVGRYKCKFVRYESHEHMELAGELVCGVAGR